MVLNEANGNLGNEARVGLIVKLLLSHFIQRIGISTRIGIAKNFGIDTSLVLIYVVVP